MFGLFLNRKQCSCIFLFMYFFPLVALQPNYGSWSPLTGVSRSHLLVGLLWLSDQPDADTSTLQYTTLTKEKHSCPQLDLNPQSQQASGHRPNP